MRLVLVLLYIFVCQVVLLDHAIVVSELVMLGDAICCICMEYLVLWLAYAFCNHAVASTPSVQIISKIYPELDTG